MTLERVLILTQALTLIVLAWGWISRRRRTSALCRLTQAFQRMQKEGVDVSFFPPAAGELRELVETGRALAESNTRERRDLEQRERLLRTLVEAAPMAIVLFSDSGRIVYTNGAARDLFFEGKAPADDNFLTMLGHAPEPLRRAVLGERDELFSVEQEGERETYYLAKRHFEIDGEVHTLLMVRHLTQEISRQEIDVWKKIIRIVAHELNNSLAPVSSLIHSARIIVQDSPQAARLARVFDTIDERARHLRSFLEGYARLARLPTPERRVVQWGPFLDGLRALWPDVAIGAPPVHPGWFDPAQMQQVLINLLKNAAESGSPRDQIELVVDCVEGGSTRIGVLDRGQGLSAEVRENALLPFYSTKDRGSGLGLPLCHEIVEAHGGRLRLRNRVDGGAEVAIRLPGAFSELENVRTRLTLTRG